MDPSADVCTEQETEVDDVERSDRGCAIVVTTVRARPRHSGEQEADFRGERDLVTHQIMGTAPALANELVGDVGPM